MMVCMYQSVLHLTNYSIIYIPGVPSNLQVVFLLVLFLEERGRPVRTVIWTWHLYIVGFMWGAVYAIPFRKLPLHNVFRSAAHLAKLFQLIETGVSL